MEGKGLNESQPRRLIVLERCSHHLFYWKITGIKNKPFGWNNVSLSAPTLVRLRKQRNAFYSCLIVTCGALTRETHISSVFRPRDTPACCCRRPHFGLYIQMKVCRASPLRWEQFTSTAQYSIIVLRLRYSVELTLTPQLPMRSLQRNVVVECDLY